MKGGSRGFGGRCAQIVTEESRSGLEELVASLCIAGKRTAAEQGNLLLRKERVGIHIVLPEPGPDDDVADFEPGLSRSRDAGEEDFINAEIGN
jgi:hypothetical protein